MEGVSARRRVHWAVRSFVLFGTVGAILTPLVYFISRPVPYCCSQKASNDRNARASLITLCSAQEDYRINDRNVNQRKDYWRGDIAGLYVQIPPGSEEAIRLIEQSMAMADAAPLADLAVYGKPGPKAGHRFKTLRFADEDPAKPSPDRFAACAFPVDTKAGSSVWIVDHTRRIFHRPWRGAMDPPSVFPADPLAEGWAPYE